MNRYLIISILISLLLSTNVNAESGYDLWLRYTNIQEKSYHKFASRIFAEVCIDDTSATAGVISKEIAMAAKGMAGIDPVFSSAPGRKVSLLITTNPESLDMGHDFTTEDIGELGPEGFEIMFDDNKPEKTLIVAANTPAGALYGTFTLLRKIQTRTKEMRIPESSVPSISRRILNHWDNLDRTVERGYAGFSIWDWHRLPGYIDQRYIDYARANASIGINGTVLTNVNANALVLTAPYIEKVKALADVFRPYGIRVYLTARFSAPMEIGGMETADPLNPEVQQWWDKKAREIYQAIPDFGGFLVKANSEGQPGPHNYGRSHAEGANMLADAVAPHGGIVMWRAFVYSHESPEDRAKQANLEFEPLDGEFRDNVVIQVKNGPIDFQPREPFHPLFGAMPETPLALELQITQEYLGQGTSLAYLGPLFQETLRSYTNRPETHTTVAEIIDGTAYNHDLSVIAGVSNIGNDMNWTGHIFGQANWYAFGRFAWHHRLMQEKVAEEWTRMTFGSPDEILEPVMYTLLDSREAVVNYMTPLGLHHIMGRGHHYGPGPWVTGGRADWTSVYYHRADSSGIGFDRTSSGSNALAQYAPEIGEKWGNPETCPDKYLLWFHHLPWDYEMDSGNTLWEELCYHYDKGVGQVKEMIATWEQLEGDIDRQRYHHVEQLLAVQLQEARWWKNSCLLYFQQFSGMPFPADIEPVEGDLEEYREMKFPYAPGIRPSW